MARIKKVQRFLEEENLEALCVTEPLDLYYLTHLKLSAGILLVKRDEATLFVDGRYLEAALQKAPCQIAPLVEFKGVEVKESLVFDSGATTYQKYLELFEQFGSKLKPFPSPIKKLRQVKEGEEITLLKNAAHLGSIGYDFVLTLLTEGIKEEEIALELELFWKKKGGERPSFDPIIAFGVNTSQPHYRASCAHLKEGDPVLIDIGVMKQSYASDMTRVVFFGQSSPQMEKIYSCVKEAQKAALEKCRPGAVLGDIDTAARNVIEKGGFGEFFPHSLGHGVGLDVHEYPLVKQGNQATVESGMVFTIEPGIYLPGVGGVRLEDTIVITEKGFESLTKRPLK